MSIKVGIQMYSVRNAMSADPIAALRKTAELGYKYIELANLTAYEDFGCGFNVKASDLKKAVSEFGAQIVSAHIFPLDEKNIDKVLEYHSELGTKYIMSKSESLSKEHALRDAENFQWIGERCKKYGIQHCIHTAFDYAYDDGSSLFSTWLDNTSPEALMMELDTYWVTRGGDDPIKTIVKYGNRIELLHQKDLPAKTIAEFNVAEVFRNAGVDKMDFSKFYSLIDERDFVEVGTGVMDLQSIIDTALVSSNAKYIMLEQDFTTMDEFDSISKSMEGFRKVKNIDWQ